MDPLMEDIVPSDAYPAPPTLKRSVSAYEITMRQIETMGFSLQAAQIAIAYTRSTNIETILEFLLKGDHGWQHPFIPSEVDPVLCLICNETIDLHMEDSGQVSQEDIKEKLKLFERQRSAGGGFEAIRPVMNTLCMICLEECKTEWRHPECADHVFCPECVQSYLVSRITGGNVLQVNCPGEGCKVLFTEEQIQELIDGETFGKYRKFKEHAEMSKDPSLKWCPTPNCEGFMRGSDTDPHLKCPLCSYEMCFKCGSKWHDNKTCEFVMDAAYEEWAKGREVQLCPKCKRRIEKITGCNHITCSVCRYEWCWLCRGAYTPSHFSPLNPFGCSNLQAEINTRARWPIWRIYLTRLGSLLLLILIILLFPLIALFWPAVGLTQEFNRRHERWNVCVRFPADVLVFSVVLVLTPFAAAVAIPILLIIGLIKLLQWCSRKCLG